MSDFDDPELERLLGRAGGAYPDVNVAYERLQVGVRRARRRRATVVGSAACGLLLATAVVAVNRSEDSPAQRVGDRPTIDGSLPDDSVDSSVLDDTTDETTAQTTDNTTASSQDTSAPTTVGDSPVTEVFSGQGGSVTVRMHNGTLEIVSIDPAAGFSAELQHNDGDRVEVRFESEDHRTDIRVDLENGAMVPDIEEDDSSEGPDD